MEDAERKAELSDLLEYFSQDELDAMGKYEKKRHINILDNYWAMKRIGMETIKPPFMKPLSSSKETSKRNQSLDDGEESDTGSDFDDGSSSTEEDWHSEYVSDSDDSLNDVDIEGIYETGDESGLSEIDEELGEGTDHEEAPADDNGSELSDMYSKHLLSYDDDYVYCSDCKKEYLDGCKEHVLHSVQDTETEEEFGSDRARKTLPPGLVIKNDDTVCTDMVIVNFTQFGPFIGVDRASVDMDVHAINGWVLRPPDKGMPVFFIEGSDPAVSNWMMFVRRATSQSDQNLEAFQYGGKIYYKTTKTIGRGQELRVLRNEDSYLADGANPAASTTLLPRTRQDTFKCGRCSTEFVNEHSARRHLLSHKATLSHDVHIPASGNRKSQRITSVPQFNEPTEDSALIDQSKSWFSVKVQSKDKNFVDQRKRSQYSYECSKCKELFSTNHNLNKHMLRVHTEDAPFRCEICDFGFMKEVFLKRHTRIQHKPHECNQCGEQFRKKTQLWSHLKSHPKPKPYECKKCEEKFTYRHELKAHRDIHRLRKCPECSAEFLKKMEFHKHYRSHEIFHCKKCAATFPKYERLNFHMNHAHKCEMHKCDKCEGGFARKSALSYHYHSVHSVNGKIECDTCQAQFGATYKYLDHRRIHTGEKPYSCEHEGCSKTFHSKRALYVHSKIHSGKRYQCELCDSAYTQNVNLKKHIKMCHDENETYHQCPQCACNFKQQMHLTRHMRIHIGEEKPYKCDDCGEKFSARYRLQLHNRYAHRGDNPFKCKECDSNFHSIHALNGHLLSHLAKRPQTCLVCSKMFADKPALRQHAKCHVEAHPYSCDECAAGFKQKGTLVAHMRTHTGEKPFPCLLCESSFTQVGARRTHMKVHHRNADLHKCKVCSAEFTHIRGLRDHMRVHDDSKPYACDQCGVRFTHNIYLQEHMSIHQNEKPWECAECGAKFALQKVLVRHQATHGAKKIECKEKNCGKKFSTQDTLLAHVRTHTGERPYNCEYCDANFTQAGSLARHRRLHDGVRDYKCDVCDASFTQSGSLARHMNIHAPEKKPKVQCSECGAQFSNRSHLTQHMRIHTGEKPYTCEECEAQFSQQANLNSHMKIHTGAIKLCCPHCEAKFTLKTNLNRHLKQMHKEKPYKCDKCDKQFLKQHLLNDHMLIHTGEKPYNCAKCDSAYHTADALKRHVLTHEQKAHTCETCGTGFHQRSTLNRHKRVHEEKPFKCSECSASFEDEKGLIWHGRTHKSKITPEGYFQCDQCDWPAFKQLTSLSRHKTLHHPSEKSSKECEQCGQIFARLTSYNKHVAKGTCRRKEKRSNAEKAAFKCEWCDSSFSRHRSLQSHSLLKHQSKMNLGIHSTTAEHPFGCVKCPKIFTDKSRLTAHCSKEHKFEEHDDRVIHREGPPQKERKKRTGNCSDAEKAVFKCEWCDSSFSRHRSLQSHSLLKHQSKMNLGIHSTTAEHPFGCEKCPKIFTDKSRLTAHRNKEHKVEQHDRDGGPPQKRQKRESTKAVESAGISESEESDDDGILVVRRDTRSLTSAKIPSSKQKVTAVEHSLSVSEDESHQNIFSDSSSTCEESDDRQRRKQHHPKTVPSEGSGKLDAGSTKPQEHGNEKIHPCGTCGQTFVTFAGLKLHIVRQHKDKYECAQCQKVLVSLDALVVHSSMMHERLLEPGELRKRPHP